MGENISDPINEGDDIGGLTEGEPLVVSEDLSPVAMREIAEAMQWCSDSIGEQIEELTKSVNHGFVQRHQHGAMFWKLHVGAHCVSGDIYDLYLSLVSVASVILLVDRFTGIPDSTLMISVAKFAIAIGSLVRSEAT
jgi:hypothetical protein